MLNIMRRKTIMTSSFSYHRILRQAGLPAAEQGLVYKISAFDNPWSYHGPWGRSVGRIVFDRIQKNLDRRLRLREGPLTHSRESAGRKPAPGPLVWSSCSKPLTEVSNVCWGFDSYGHDGSYYL